MVSHSILPYVYVRKTIVTNLYSTLSSRAGAKGKQGLGECVNSIPHYQCKQGGFIGAGRYWQRITCFRCKQHQCRRQTRILIRTKWSFGWTCSGSYVTWMSSTEWRKVIQLSKSAPALTDFDCNPVRFGRNCPLYSSYNCHCLLGLWNKCPTQSLLLWSGGSSNFIGQC